MGRLEKGKWVSKDLLEDTQDGEYERWVQPFRSSIAPDGRHPPEKDRYHLYVSYACPWAHRTLIFRKLKKLEDLISVSVVHPHMLDDGWIFRTDFEGATEDHVFGKKLLHQVYTEAVPDFTGEVTVPVLFDKKRKEIVNSESPEIIRILNSAFNELTGNSDDYYPSSLKNEIDEINAEIYSRINNGVYRVGFALKQAAYERNVKSLFSALEHIEQRLEGRDFLVGDRLTEADVRLYTTLIRFDPVYHGHFKCNLKMIRQYKNLSRYLANLYAWPAFRDTTEFDHIKAHYYYSHTQLNPTQIVPTGPDPLVVTEKDLRAAQPKIWEARA